MATETLKRNFFQRILGICATKEPADEGCWRYVEGKVTVDLSRASELESANGAIRLEKKGGLPERILVFKGTDGQYHAIWNQCSHGKRRLDPMSSASQVQCCSVGKSVFDYEGKRISGSAKSDITAYPVSVEDGKLIITL